MKALVKGFVKWLIVVLLGLNCILWTAIIANCQEKNKEVEHKTLHTDRGEWEETIGLKFITVTSKDERLIYFYQVRKFERRISSLGYDKDTRFDFGAAKKPYEFSGCFVAFYCKTHLMIYLMSRVPCFEDDKDIPPKL